MIRNKYEATKLACYVGYIVQAIVNNFLPILFIIFQEEYGLGYEKLGRIMLVNFASQIAVDSIAPVFEKFFGYRGAAIFSQAAAAAGLVLLAILPKLVSNIFVAVLVPTVIYCMGSGLTEVILSPMMEMLPTKNKAANMAFMHSFYCWGQAVTVIGTTLMVKLFGYGGWNYIPLVWAVIPFINTFSFIKAPIVEPKDGEKGEKLKNLVKNRDFLCFVIFMICAGSSEITMSEWASMFAQQGLKVSKVTGDLLGPCAFAVFMGVGRIVYGLLSGKYSVRKVLILNNIICLGCYLTVGVTNNPVLALAACALCGFSVSLSWPGTYSMAAARFKSGGTAMFSVLALCGDFGCSIGPWLLGLVADYGGLKTGFLVSIVFPLIMVLTAMFIMKDKKEVAL